MDAEQEGNRDLVGKIVKFTVFREIIRRQTHFYALFLTIFVFPSYQLDSFE